jgi:hypothetical protein
MANTTIPDMAGFRMEAIRQVTTPPSRAVTMQP